MAKYTYYIIDNEKLVSNNKVSIHNYCHAPRMASDKEEAVQLMYLLYKCLLQTRGPYITP